MEEIPVLTTPACRSVSFKTLQHQSTNTNGKLKCWSREEQCLKKKETLSSSSCCCSSSEIDIPHNPIHAMEFLCRSWSPSAYKFQQIFTSVDMCPSDDKFSSGELPVEKMEIESTKELPADQDGTSTIISTSRDVDDIWMDKKHAKGWLGGKSLTSLFRRHRVKKKEDIRLRTASVHAALSVTRLAAAIASVAAAKASTQSPEDHGNNCNGNHIIIGGDIVASAAALVTKVCAEAAESLGAKTAHVSSAIHSGLATQRTDDMITLTAAAATCLRGVAALKARAMANAYFPRTPNLVQVKAELSVVTPSGSRRYVLASIYSKHSQLMLSLQKKHLGFLARTKEYKILHVMEGTQEAQGSLSISLKSNNGNIKLLFKDENQSLVWTSSISNLLETHH